MLWALGYRALRAAFRAVLAGVFRWRVEGRERIPAAGPVLICANHISWWDIPLVACMAPRRVYFMAKEELFRYPVFGWLIAGLGAFPVQRGQPDRRSLHAALQHLAAGRAVVVYVEGTRSRTGELLPAQPGAAWLAVKARVPVVPVAILGPYRPFRPVRAAAGTPLELKEYYERRVNTNDLAEAGARIMEEIRRLLEGMRSQPSRPPHLAAG